MPNSDSLAPLSLLHEQRRISWHEVCALLLSLLLIAPAAAADPDAAMLEALQADMQKYSRLATDTKQNVDYMPYVVSTLDAEQLSRLGVLTLKEALGLVPGVDLSVGMAGVKNPIFRGSNPYAFGQSQLVIDGVVVNDQLFGGYSQYLDMPIALIHRIEVVRGPGSLQSHVNGYAGSIHVITKANRDDGAEKENTLFGAVGSNDQKLGGYTVAYNGAHANISSDFFYQNNDLELPVDADRFGNAGMTDQSLRNYSLGVNAETGNFKFIGRTSRNDSGVSYGQAFSLSDDTSDYLDIKNNYFQISHRATLSDGITLNTSLDYNDERRALQNKVMPDGAMLMMPPMMLPNGRYFLVDYSEHTFQERVELEISRLDNHLITTGVLFSQSSVEHNSARFSDNDLQSFFTTDMLLTDGRDLTSVYIDDIFDVSEKISLQAGLKYDNYSDSESLLSPRLAMVYRYNDDNLFKLMYTRAHREPSWREQYLGVNAFFRSTLDLEPETVQAYEAAYIRKFGLSRHLKLNAFHLDNSDQIHAQNPTNTFLNSGDGTLRGIELEIKTPLFGRDLLNLNYSYVEGSNVGGQLANSAAHVANAYYTYFLNSDLSLSGIFRHVDAKGRIPDDTRSDVSDYQTVDVALDYRHIPSGLGFNLSIKNLFDEDYALSAPANTYTDDFEQDGRGVLFSVRKRF